MSDLNLDNFLESRFTYRHTDGNIYARVKDLREWMKGKVLVPFEEIELMKLAIDTLHKHMITAEKRGHDKAMENMKGKVLVPVEPSREAALKEALQELYDYSGPPINQEWLSAMEKARELLKEAT